MVRWILLLAVGCTYSPGTFTSGTKPFAGQRETIGCLDIAIDRRADHDGAAVLAYRFGNRCDKKQTVDFAAVRVIGRDDAGNELALVPFDPAGQLRPLPLDARLAGGEVIAYPARQQLVQVCVDAASLVQATPVRWLCFAQPSPSQDQPGDAIAPSERMSEVVQ